MITNLTSNRREWCTIPPLDARDLVWKSPDGITLLTARHHQTNKRWLAILPADDSPIGFFAGATTLRAAYEEACRQHRMARHSTERLLRQRARLIRSLRTQRQKRPGQHATTDFEAAVCEILVRARIESMALRHRIGTKDTLAALGVLVDEAIRAQGLGLAQFRASQAEAKIAKMKRGQKRLQRENEALRSQLAQLAVREGS